MGVLPIIRVWFWVTTIAGSGVRGGCVEDVVRGVCGVCKDNVGRGVIGGQCLECRESGVLGVWYMGGEIKK
jgi:hypothetical protein